MLVNVVGPIFLDCVVDGFVGVRLWRKTRGQAAKGISLRSFFLSSCGWSPGIFLLLSSNRKAIYPGHRFLSLYKGKLIQQYLNLTHGNDARPYKYFTLDWQPAATDVIRGWLGPGEVYLGGALVLLWRNLYTVKPVPSVRFTEVSVL